MGSFSIGIGADPWVTMSQVSNLSQSNAYIVSTCHYLVYCLSLFVHVPSLVSKPVVLRQFGERSLPVVKSLLTEALRLDRMNYSAWYNLGLLYKDKGVAFALEAAECFEAAVLLEATAPVEPFR